jgi:transcriptional regulator with XRE-family HTH domain
MSNKSRKDFGEKLKGLRTAKGSDQYELARRVGSTATTVGRWENAKTTPRPYNVIGLKRELGLSEDDFLLAFEIQPPLPPKSSGPYRACNFASAQERLGSIEAVDEARGEMEDEWPVPEEEGEYGTDEKWLELHRLSPESGGVVMHHDNEIVGYWESLAVRDDTYEAILRGENVNKEIAPDDIVILMVSGTYKMYFVDLFLRKAHTNIVTRRLLTMDFLAFMREAAEAGIFFDRIAANITGVEAKYQCQNLGFRKVTDHQVHKYFDRTGAEVPAEIFELVIGPDAKRLFSFDSKLAELYAAQDFFEVSK